MQAVELPDNRSVFVDHPGQLRDHNKLHRCGGQAEQEREDRRRMDGKVRGYAAEQSSRNGRKQVRQGQTETSQVRDHLREEHQEEQAPRFRIRRDRRQTKQVYGRVHGYRGGAAVQKTDQQVMSQPTHAQIGCKDGRIVNNKQDR